MCISWTRKGLISLMRGITMTIVTTLFTFNVPAGTWILQYLIVFSDVRKPPPFTLWTWFKVSEHQRYCMKCVVAVELLLQVSEKNQWLFLS